MLKPMNTRHEPEAFDSEMIYDAEVSCDISPRRVTELCSAPT
jgi:hypothetical protein